MGYKSFSGGGTPGGTPAQYPGAHTIDASTWHQWSFNNTMADGGTENATMGGTPGYASHMGNDHCFDNGGGNNGVSTSISGKASKTGAAITLAVWVYPTVYATVNGAWIGVRGGGSSGNPDAFNFCWELGFMANSGETRAFHQYDNKQLGGTLGAEADSIPALGEWSHLAASRSVDGTAWYVYKNGVLVESATGVTAWNGGASMNSCYIGSNGSGAFTGFLSSATIRGEYLDGDGMAALYADAQQTLYA